MPLVAFLLNKLRRFTENLSHSAHKPIMMPRMAGAFAGIFIVMMLPVRLHVRRWRGTAFLRRAVRYCRQSHLAILALQHVRRRLEPIAWITRFKATSRRFSRLTP